MTKIILTNHAKYRLLERSIGAHGARKVAKTGRVINIDLDGIITRKGLLDNGRPLIVKTKESGKNIIIITAYYGD